MTDVTRAQIVQRRNERYLRAFEEVVASKKCAYVSDHGYDGPAPELPVWVDCMITEGKMDRMLLHGEPQMNGSGCAFVPMQACTSTADLFQRVNDAVNDAVMISEKRFCLGGQKNVLRAILDAPPESADVLLCTGRVVCMRAPKSMIMGLRGNLTSVMDVNEVLVEMVARLQEQCLVSLTCSNVNGETPGEPRCNRARLIAEARARRKSVAVVPETHEDMIVRPEFAEEAMYKLLEASSTSDKPWPPGTEIVLMDLYKLGTTRMRLPPGEEFPLNHVRRHVERMPRGLEPVPEAGLPRVTIATITRNRPRLFAMAVHNFISIEYPKDLLEWVIVDDSDVGLEAKRSLGCLKSDNRVRYVRMELMRDQPPLTVGLKRNIACRIGTGDVFVVMDDDDFMHRRSVMTRVAAMRATGARCTGSVFTLCYDTSTKVLFYTTVHDRYGDAMCFAEPSMAFTRSFWEERNWNKDCRFGEGRAFLEDREVSDLLDVPSEENVICITHRSNMTMDLRRSAGGMTVEDPEALFGRDFYRIMRAATSV